VPGPLRHLGGVDAAVSATTCASTRS
jgi:hypothetical protein